MEGINAATELAGNTIAPPLAEASTLASEAVTSPVIESLPDNPSIAESATSSVEVPALDSTKNRR